MNRTKSKNRISIVACIAMIWLTACEVPSPAAKDLLAVTRSQLVPTRNDVAYGTLPDQVLDIYTPAGDAPDDSTGDAAGRAVIFLHGGGWNGGTEADLIPVARWFVEERGWTLISVRYRLTRNGVTFPTPLQDVKQAIRWTKANHETLAIDPAAVVVMGWSAGGHLAALAGLTAGSFEPEDMSATLAAETSRPAAVVSLAAPLNPETFAATDGYGHANRASVESLLGCEPSQDVRACPVSPDDVHVVKWADRMDSPIYIGQGDLDPITDSVSQTLVAYPKLVSAMGNRNVWLDVVDTGPVGARQHSVDYGLNLSALDAFLRASGSPFSSG